MQPNTQTSQPLKVIIAGGGVAGLESAFALHELAGDRVDVTVIAPGEEFIYRPLSIGEPFSSRLADRYPLGPLAAAGRCRARARHPGLGRRRTAQHPNR